MKTRQDSSIRIEQDKIYLDQYWVVWPDGVKSTYTYNLTWAREHCRRIEKGEDEDV